MINFPPVKLQTVRYFYCLVDMIFTQPVYLPSVTHVGYYSYHVYFYCKINERVNNDTQFKNGEILQFSVSNKLSKK